MFLHLFINALFWYCKFGHNFWVYYYWHFLSPFFLLNCKCTGPRLNQTTSMLLPGRREWCIALCATVLWRGLVGLFSVQHPALFHFPRESCWDSRLHSNELTLFCLSSYVFCVLDCEGDVLEGIHGLHSKWRGLSKLLCLYYWGGLISFFFPWWFEVVRVVQLLLNKILQIKKKKNQLLVCRSQTGLGSCVL